ncbi:hypothetical protein L1887_40379 [Cichorium endivia]|nr:hypothetical protein L1887_40379 [Cichorium endivia]
MIDSLLLLSSSLSSSLLNPEHNELLSLYVTPLAKVTAFSNGLITRQQSFSPSSMLRHSPTFLPINEKVPKFLEDLL